MSESSGGAFWHDFNEGFVIWEAGDDVPADVVASPEEAQTLGDGDDLVPDGPPVDDPGDTLA